MRWTYNGVNFSLPGAGGPACSDYLSLRQKVAETFLICFVSFLEIWYSWVCFQQQSKTTLASKQTTLKVSINSNRLLVGRQILLVSLSLVFGVELGFKLASGQLIWSLNPCHIVTIIQIYLLASSPSRIVTILFRTQLHMLSGVVIALFFPVVNTRMLPFEVTVYWLQHLLILVIPVYLMTLGEPYSVEPLPDMSWPMLVLAMQFLYHFLFLQPIAMVTSVNLNNILCPAISDPFKGRFYRAWALFHQSLLVLVHGKAFILVCLFLLNTSVTFSHFNPFNFTLVCTTTPPSPGNPCLTSTSPSKLKRKVVRSSEVIVASGDDFIATEVLYLDALKDA